MPTTTLEPVSFPDEAELEQAHQLLQDATEHLCHLAWRVRRLRDADAITEFHPKDEREAHRRQANDPVPTFEDIGRLFAYGISLRNRMEELTDYINDVTSAEALDDLHTVRLELGES